MSSQTSAIEFLIREFCEAFASVFEQTSGKTYALKNSSIDKPTESSGTLDYALQFSGKISGRAFVRVELHAAAILATRLMEGNVDDSVSYLPEHEDALYEIVSQTAGVMTAELRTQFGTAEISVERAQNAAAATSVSITLEPATEADHVSIVLLAEPTLMNSIEASLSGSMQPASPLMGESTQVSAQDTASEHHNLRLIMDVELNLTLRFGQRVLMLSEIAELAAGSVVELDRVVDDPVELLLGERVIARGEVVIVDGNYGLRVTDIAPVDQNSLLSV